MAKTRSGGRIEGAKSRAACGCSAAYSGPGPVGPGGLALAVDPVLKEANLKHLRRIEGQVRGIAAMVEEDRYCADIITQVAAVRESLHSVARNLMRNHIKHCANAALREDGGGDGGGRDAMIDELLELVAKIAR